MRRLVQGKNQRWKITVEPDGIADVTITLLETLDCGNPGAICIGTRPLSADVEVTVPGPGPLTAEIRDISVEAHDGSTAFTFELRFSENWTSGLSYATLRDSAFTVTNGKVTGARRLKARKNQRWEITVEPDGNADVTITLPETTDCDASGAICIETRPLSAEVEVTVPGPATVPVENSAPTADAGTDQTLQEGSEVTLSGTASDPDGDNLAYSWTYDRDDLGVSLDDPAVLSTTFTAPQVDSETTITFTLTATDEHDATTSDTVTVTIQDIPADPPQENTAVLEPDDPRGSRDIGRITLVSSQPGTIQAGWEAPSETPADYRISWAKADEAFRTWTDLSGNAFPTEPSYTITGLEGAKNTR